MTWGAYTHTVDRSLSCTIPLGLPLKSTMCCVASSFISSRSPFSFVPAQDFADTIPGHGGIMDRFDCQYLMATFVNVYIASFIR